MQIKSIVQLLQNTLNPSLINQAESNLLNRRQQQGFLTKLLIVGDDNNCNISIRQSALIYAKNALVDDYNKVINLSDNDFQTLKSSVLQALIRNCQQKSLTSILKEIIYILAQNQYPTNWTQVIPEISNSIQNSGDFNEIFGSIEGLKAIVSSIGAKVDQKVSLQNLCNKIVIPLLSLASKLFQNYNQTTSLILISIFKIFSTINYFRIPEVVILNMHSWMIFIKKLLDLNIQSGNIDKNMYQLKKICLRILFRFYQRHFNQKYTYHSHTIVNEFHNKFTKGIVQSLLLQIINQDQLSKNSHNKNYIQLTKFSLVCLSYIYQQNRNAAIVIDNYRDKILYLCLERHKIKVSKGFSSYNQFSCRVNEQRIQFCMFIKSLLRNQTKKNQQINKGNYNFTNSEQVNTILSTLLNCIQKGDMQMKELCLYIYSDVSQILQEIDEQIQEKMQVFILNIIKPLLKNSDIPSIIKLRCCEIISKYSFIQIPQSQLTDIGGGVYECLISNSKSPQSGSLQTFLQIHAIHAFNSLLRYDYIINFTSPFLNNILSVYTSLLEIQVSIIKCLQDMLQKFESYLQPYGNHLIELLTNIFFKYNDLIFKQKSGQIQKGNNQFNEKFSNNEGDEDWFQIDNGYDNVDSNYLNASKACLGAIRQIIKTPQFNLEKESLIHDLLVSIFSDKQQYHVEQGFNILNQVIFKKKFINSQYNIYFSLIIFGILPLPQEFFSQLQSQNSNYSNALLNMLKQVCVQQDLDFIQNTIGCLRNFISKYQKDLKNQIDKSGFNFLQLLLKSVKYVHQNQSNKATQTDRSIILTIYISLLQWNALNDEQVKEIYSNISLWLNMEKQVCLNSIKNNSNNQKIGQQKNQKTIYSPIYLQIILLGCHFYPEITLNSFDGNWIVRQLLENWERIHCDYEIGRLLIGIGDLINYQVISDKQICGEIMNRLPDMIERQCKIRAGDVQNDARSEGDEAEEQKCFGMDENTHIIGWKNNNNGQQYNQNKDNKEGQQMDEEDEESQDYEQQFNKYYLSPLDEIDEISYISNVLKSSNSGAYLSLMGNDQQQKLSFLVLNAPSKFSSSSN